MIAQYDNFEANSRRLEPVTTTIGSDPSQDNQPPVRADCRDESPEGVAGKLIPNNKPSAERR